MLRRLPARGLALGAATLVVVVAVAGLTQARRVDELTHQLIYRQTTTRMETLGRLYHDPSPSDAIVQGPYRSGASIALIDPRTGWLTPGLVEDASVPGSLTVSLVDDTERTVPVDDNVMLLQSAPIPPLQLLNWLAPSALGVFAGVPSTDEAPNLAWIAAALAWDVLLIVALVGIKVRGLGLRDWLYPLCVVGGTVLALSAIPGAPGNAERHRATQTVPLLLVLASGVVSSRVRLGWLAGRMTINHTRMPTTAATAVASSRRSPR